MQTSKNDINKIKHPSPLYPRYFGLSLKRKKIGEKNNPALILSFIPKIRVSISKIKAINARTYFS